MHYPGRFLIKKFSRISKEIDLNFENIRHKFFRILETENRLFSHQEILRCLGIYTES